MTYAVMPAKAGFHRAAGKDEESVWTEASAGVTGEG